MGQHFRRWLFALVVLLTVIAGIYVAGWVYGVVRAFSTILVLYFYAWLLQFFLTPLVDLLARRRLPRILAVSGVYLILGVFTAVVIVVTTPAAISQGSHLANDLSQRHTYTIISDATQAIEKFAEQRLHVPSSEIKNFTKNYSVSLQNGAVQAGTKLQEIIRSRFTSGSLSSSATTFLAFLDTVNTLLLNVVIVLILAFYMMLDGHKLVAQALAYFPPAVSEVIRAIHDIVTYKFGGYLRGQIILAFSYGLLTYLVAIGFHLQYPLFVASFAAIMMLVPFIGTVIAIVPPLVGFVLAHVADHPFPLVGLLLLFFSLAAIQHVVINLLAPRVMGTAMGMHPLLVLLGLLLGAQMAGLWGAIFGVPVFGALVESIDLVYRRVMESRYGFHPPGDAGAATTSTPRPTDGRAGHEPGRARQDVVHPAAASGVAPGVPVSTGRARR